jgi:hypothetical protein
LGVSFPCMEQSAQQAGIPLPQSVLASLQQQEKQQEQQQEDTAATRGSAATIDNDGIPCSSPSSVIGSDNDDTVDQITAMVQDCVQHNILTQMDGRDLIRCLMTQHVCAVDVYTVSQESGAVYHPRRHVSANFNRGNFVAKLIKHFGGKNTTASTPTTPPPSSSSSNNSILFDQVILDYFWIPLGWDAQHWTRNFFSNVLPDLSHVLQPHNGVIYLPFCCHCFQQVLVCRYILTRHYNISFVRRRRQRHKKRQQPRRMDGGDDDEINDESEIMEMDEPIYLWQGTRHINAKIMQGVFGKRLDQEEVYCTFGPRHVKEGNLQDGAISQEIVLATCRQLEDFYDIRFIALRRIPSPPQEPQQLDAAASSAVAAAAVDDGEVAGAVSAPSLSSSLPSISADTLTSVPAAVVAVTPIQQSQQPRRQQVSRRILPVRTCRLSEPNATTTPPPINQSPPPSATKRALFPKNNQTRKNSENFARPTKMNPGSILGLQDPRTIQRGFYSTATAASSSNVDHKNSDVASTRTSTTTTRTTTKRVVTPTPATRNRKRKTSFSSSSPLPSRQDDDEQEEMDDKKPKSLF